MAELIGFSGMRSTNNKLIGALCTAGAGLLAVNCAGPAPAERSAPAEQAQRVQRIVAFGDSYADDGNIFELFGSRPSALYPRGRFSDGTNFVDTMGEILRVPIANFALGGAVTGAGSGNRPAGLDQQVDAFLAGGGPAYFPRVSGKLSGNDLVAVSIGGNDARAYEKSFGRPPSPEAAETAIAKAPAAAAVSVANGDRALGRLVRAGAKNILFLGGDVGRLPEVEGQVIARIGTAFSNSYNAGMREVLARYEDQGVKVTYVDLDRLLERVKEDPAAYGLASAGACPAACATDRSLASKYLFYVDRLHLTSAGFAIVGRQAVEQLRAGRAAKAD